MATITTETRTERWLLSCRRCKHILTREVTMIVTRTQGTYYLGSYRPGKSLAMVEGSTFWYPRVVCPSCGNWERDGDRAMMGAQRITGRQAPEVRCDSRCTGAKGSECVCSCGGANHGVDHTG